MEELPADDDAPAADEGGNDDEDTTAAEDESAAEEDAPAALLGGATPEDGPVPLVKAAARELDTVAEEAPGPDAEEAVETAPALELSPRLLAADTALLEPAPTDEAPLNAAEVPPEEPPARLLENDDDKTT